MQPNDNDRLKVTQSIQRAGRHGISPAEIKNRLPFTSIETIRKIADELVEHDQAFYAEARDAYTWRQGRKSETEGHSENTGQHRRRGLSQRDCLETYFLPDKTPPTPEAPQDKQETKVPENSEEQQENQEDIEQPPAIEEELPPCDEPEKSGIPGVVDLNENWPPPSNPALRITIKPRSTKIEEIVIEGEPGHVAEAFNEFCESL